MMESDGGVFETSRCPDLRLILRMVQVSKNGSGGGVDGGRCDPGERRELNEGQREEEDGQGGAFGFGGADEGRQVFDIIAVEVLKLLGQISNCRQHRDVRNDCMDGILSSRCGLEHFGLGFGIDELTIVGKVTQAGT